MVFDAKDQHPSQWAAIESIAGKIEVRELRRANEILKLASAFFAQAELVFCPARTSA